MGLRINTNISSLAAQAALRKSTSKVNQALTRLSTGLRINTGSDDVVGLAKSESLRSQVRGINQAQANIASSSSVLGVGEGYLAQLTEIAQQMRETAVQSADDTLSSADRSALSTKFSDLMNEYNRLANNANFNGVKLLDGTFTSKSVQVGSNQGDTISITISDARSTAIGQVAVLTSSSRSYLGAAATTLTDVDLAYDGGITINGSAMGTLASDGASASDADESAIAYVNAINAVSGTTGVTATVNANVFTLNYGAASYALGAAVTFSINGVTVKTGTDGSVGTSNDTEAQTLTNLINAKSSSTGVVATLDTAGDTIILTASDGRNIAMTTNGNAAGINALGYTGAAAATPSTVGMVAYRGTFTLQSTTSFTIAGAATEFASAASVTANVTSNSALSYASLASATTSGAAITTLDNVIAQLQTRRGNIGSALNRFQVAESELGARLENISAAESRIRDADMAEETAKLTQAQILQQAGVTVLGAANSAPQIALQLLQGLGG